jgi:hypothetical protein
MTLEELALSGATNLLTFLQYDRLNNQEMGAIALAGTLCELLNQLESIQPGVSDPYGWQKADSIDENVAAATWDTPHMDHDRYSDFDSPRLS